MYAVSDQYKEAMKQSVQRFRMTGTVGNLGFDDDNILQGSFSITNQCSDNSSVLIGQVYIGELDVTLVNINFPRYSMKNKVIKPIFGLQVANGTYEDVPLGVYTVSEAEWTASGCVVKAYDNMAKMDKTCNINSATGLPYALAKMACDTCGVTLGTNEVEFSKFANGSTMLSMYTDSDIETWRDFISWVAQTCGCNVMADRNGNIIFRAYGQNIVDTIGTENRFSGGSFSDYETTYTGIQCTNIAESTTSYYAMPSDDGLTYSMGSNPFLQYGVDAALETNRRNVLDALQQIKYVPFKLKMIGNPAYDLMDVFSFPEGLGDGEKLFCMTKYVFTYHGSYEMTGVGQNPELSSAKSKSDKDISGLMNQSDDEGMHYTVYTNTDEIVVADGERRSVMNITFIVQQTTHVVIEMQFQILAETTEEENVSDAIMSWVENDAVCKVTYYLNGEEINVSGNSVETWQDGKHILILRYDLQAVAAQIHTWDVWMEMSGGNVTLPQYTMLGIVSGTGLAGEAEWDGNISAYDDIHAVHFEKMLGKYTDTIKLSGDIPKKATPNDKVKSFNFMNMFGLFKETIGSQMPIMTFTPWVNTDKASTGCSYNTTVGWIGSGTTVLGTELSVITVAMCNISRVESISQNAIFYASFDDGDTWCGWTVDGWLEGTAMIEADIEAVTAEQWATGGEYCRIKVCLEDNASLFTLDVYGATL